MVECLILGDSIGVGLQMHRPECVSYAKGGINTWQFNKQYPGEFFANSVIISLGSNDHKYVKTRKELEALRNRVTAKSRVIWILPAGNAKGSGVDIQDIRTIVMEISHERGDFVVDPKPDAVSKDGIHPSDRGYRWMASYTKAVSLK